MVGMKHGSNPRRGRSRGGNSGKRNQSSRGNAHESNGPDGKVRGSAHQIYEKYLSLARDAASAGEHIAAEGFFQFAEHYYRISNVDAANNQGRNRQQQGDQQNGNGQQNEVVDAVSDAESDGGSKSKSRRSPKKSQETDNAKVAADDSIGNTLDVAEETQDISDTKEPKSDAADASDDADLAASA